MDKAKSFICEHTAEYILIPNLKNILHKRFSIITPIFPWTTREGSIISRQLHKHDKFRVVGLYPRRPKLISANNSEITIKINDQILLGAQCGMKLGIPIIAGCPLVINFWALGNNPNCVWLKLDQGSIDGFELKVENIQPPFLVNQMSRFLFSNEEELLTYLDERAEPKDLDTAMLSFITIKRASRRLESHSYFMLMGGYKPVYFLLK